MTIAVQLSASEKTHAKPGSWRGDTLHGVHARTNRSRQTAQSIVPGFLPYTSIRKNIRSGLT